MSGPMGVPDERAYWRQRIESYLKTRASAPCPIAESSAAMLLQELHEALGGDDPLVCAAKKSNSDPPQDCDWPFCGCDLKAARVIGHLEEMGRLLKHDPEAVCRCSHPYDWHAPSGPCAGSQCHCGEFRFKRS